MQQLTYLKDPGCWERLYRNKGLDRGMRWLDGITESTMMSCANSGRLVMDSGSPGMLRSAGVAKSWTQSEQLNCTETTWSPAVLVNMSISVVVIYK